MTMVPVTIRRTAALMLMLSMLVGWVRVASAQPQGASFVAKVTADGTSIFLRGAGATANPPTLFLDTEAPEALVAKTRNAGAMRFAGGMRGRRSARGRLRRSRSMWAVRSARS
jgi:hypothetical protein